MLKLDLQYFGGRGASGTLKNASGKVAMSRSEFLARKGVENAASGWVLDKLRSNKTIGTEKGKKRFMQEAEKAEHEYQEKRNAAIAEFNDMVASGKVREKTNIENLLDRAKGHPDLQATQAARRVLEKRGIDWKTGKPQSAGKFKNNMFPSHTYETVATINGYSITRMKKSHGYYHVQTGERTYQDFRTQKAAKEFIESLKKKKR